MPENGSGAEHRVFGKSEKVIFGSRQEKESTVQRGWGKAWQAKGTANAGKSFLRAHMTERRPEGLDWRVVRVEGPVKDENQGVRQGHIR